MAHALLSKSFGVPYALAKVLITHPQTGAPATILSGLNGGEISPPGQTNLDANGDLNVYVESGVNWNVVVSGGQGGGGGQGNGGQNISGAVNPGNGLNPDVPNSSITSTTTSPGITPTVIGGSAQFNIVVSNVSGTSPTMDVVVQESDNSGISWYDVYQFPRITAAGSFRSPILPLAGTKIRYVQTLGGTNPNFNRGINRVTHLMTSPPLFRQIFDRAVVSTTLNATTSSLRNNGASNIQLVLSMGAITTTAPAFQIEGSDDNGASWYAIGSPLTGVASSTVQLTVANFNTDLIRARVSTAGVGSTLGYVLLKCFGK